jgi:hypothetical protein
MLTVEEAARLLRIGRTKAYALAREYRRTGGRSGLPVVDFGDVLRVPLVRLEALIGGSLDGTPTTVDPGPVTAVEMDVLRSPEATDSSTPSPPSRRTTKRQRNRTDAQLSLIDLTSSD